MKSIVLLSFIWLISGIAHAETPRLFREDGLNPALLAEAVNHYVDLGERDALEELTDLSQEYGVQVGQAGFEGPMKVGWILRILYMQVGDKPLRGPYYGAAMFPHYSHESWPLFPVVVSGISYFILDESLILGGVSENPTDYLEYCRTNGRFRTKRIQVPSRGEALRDVFALRSSQEWKALKWKDSGLGWSYEYSEKHTWSYIENQAQSIGQGEDLQHAQ